MDNFKCGRIKISAQYTNGKHTADIDVSEFENPIIILTQHVDLLDDTPFHVAVKHESGSDTATVVISSTQGLAKGDYYVNYIISEAYE